VLDAGFLYAFALLRSVRIRPCRESDLDEVMEIERDSFKFPYPREVFERALMGLGEIVVSEDESGRISGYAMYAISGGKATLVSIAVRSSDRRKGIGGFLLGHVLRRLEGRVRYMELQVGETNTPAILFYLKQGFRVVGFLPYYYPDGEGALLMKMELQPPAP